MEMERPHPVWTGYSGWYSVGFFGSCCVGLKRGVVVQNGSGFWYRLLAISFAVGYVLGYGVAMYVAVTLGR